MALCRRKFEGLFNLLGEKPEEHQLFRYNRAGHLKWIVVLILQVIVVMFETTGGLVRGHLVKNSCLTKLSKLLFFRGRFRHENSLESKK